jgi:hypothetical protein
LSEGYQRALSSKDCFQIHAEEEFAEYITFLASVANDAQRLANYLLHSMEEGPLCEMVSGLNQSMVGVNENVPFSVWLSELQRGTAAAFDDVCLRSLDMMAGLLFQSLFKGREPLLGPQMHLIWKRANEDADLADIRLFAFIVDEVIEDLLDISSYLQPEVFGLLLEACANKIVLILLQLLRALRSDGIFISDYPVLRTKLLEDTSCIDLGFNRLMQRLDSADLSQLRKHVQRPLDMLNQIVVLIYEQIFTVPFISCLKDVAALAQQDASRSYGLYRLVNTCFAMRGMSSCFPRKLALRRPSSSTSKPGMLHCRIYHSRTFYG